MKRLSHLQQAKALIRARQRELSLALTPPQLSAASMAIVARLRESALFQNANGILFYASIQGEPRLETLITEAILAGKQVALPRFEPVNGIYSTALIESLSSLQKAQFGILEPHSSAPAIPMNQLDLALVPGVAFDCGGGRLGRGKGFYDRLLMSARAVKCGIALDHQIEAGLPCEPHDLTMNCIVTPSRWIDVPADAGSK
jgi:5-formyltetrahydrofolate cyclo-ligase